jgi:hypothetical protein
VYDENTMRMVKKYPEVFDVESRSFTGIDCGWTDIIERLLEEIAPEMEKIGSTVEQVKEKFGGLRFYVSRYNEKISTAINSAEAESFKTCEYCGTKECTTTEGGWIKTLCEKCRTNKLGV